MYLLAVRRQRDLQVRVGLPDWRHRLGGRCGGRCWRCGRLLCPDGGPGDEPSSADDHARGCECSEPSSLHDSPSITSRKCLHHAVCTKPYSKQRAIAVSLALFRQHRRCKITKQPRSTAILATVCRPPNRRRRAALHVCRPYFSANGSGSSPGGDMRKTLRIIEIST